MEAFATKQKEFIELKRSRLRDTYRLAVIFLVSTCTSTLLCWYWYGNLPKQIFTSTVCCSTLSLIVYLTFLFQEANMEMKIRNLTKQSSNSWSCPNSWSSHYEDEAFFVFFLFIFELVVIIVGNRHFEV